MYFITMNTFKVNTFIAYMPDIGTLSNNHKSILGD